MASIPHPAGILPRGQPPPAGGRGESARGGAGASNLPLPSFMPRPPGAAPPRAGVPLPRRSALFLRPIPDHGGGVRNDPPRRGNRNRKIPCPRLRQRPPASKRPHPPKTHPPPTLCPIWGAPLPTGGLTGRIFRTALGETCLPGTLGASGGHRPSHHLSPRPPVGYGAVAMGSCRQDGGIRCGLSRLPEAWPPVRQSACLAWLQAGQTAC